MPKCTQTEYDERALRYAERYGIVTYKVKGNEMHYTEEFRAEKSKYRVTVNLDSMTETRKEVRR